MPVGVFLTVSRSPLLANFLVLAFATISLSDRTPGRQFDSPSPAPTQNGLIEINQFIELGCKPEPQIGTLPMNT